MLNQAFANLAAGWASALGVPYVDAVATWPGAPTLDDGGSIIAAGTPVSKTCKAQFDTATEAMRQAEGFLATDVRILVLAATLDGSLDTNAKIVVAEGEYAGAWALLSCQRDPAGIGYECRGRRG